MIKRANNKKKKGFTLIELIIVLAVMAIIALIAIPNFTAVRDNSKVKADVQSIETVKRTILMLTSDETIKGNDIITVTFNSTTGKIAAATITGTTMIGGDTNNKAGAEKVIKEALGEVTKPQGNKIVTTANSTKTDTAKGCDKISIVVADTGITVSTVADTTQ